MVTEVNPRVSPDNVPIALARAREALMTYMRPFLAELGFTEQQWRVLRVAAEFGPMDTTTLADRSALMMPSLTRIVQALERDGALTRKRDLEDSRRILIEVTPKTQRIMEESRESCQQVGQEIESAIGTQKLVALNALLDELSKIRKAE